MKTLLKTPSPLRKQATRSTFLRGLTYSLGGMLLVYLLISLFWRMEHDIPLLNYTAFLMNEHDLMVYKDIFATSMPGTFIFHSFYTKLFGYSDLGYRLCDLFFLFLCLWGVYKLLSKTDKETAAFACVIWGLYYLNFGRTMGLQKDYVGMLPLLFASVLLLKKNKVAFTYFLIGLLLALAFWVKPHLLLWVFPAAVYLFCWEREKISLRQATLGLAGFLLPTLLIVYWLYSQRALAAWGSIFFDYIPLHVQLNGTHHLLHGWSEKFGYRLEGLAAVFINYPSNILLLLVFVWIFIKRESFPRKNVVYFLLLATVTFYFYPAIAGQFWIYHWVPFFFFAVMGVALLFYLLKSQAKPWVPILLLSAFTVFLLRDSFFELYPDKNPKEWAVDDLASWIRNNTSPGETIQPLDWSTGALHAMLLTERKIATKYLYDYHFYHHVSHATIRELRRDFLKEIRQNRPDYFVDMHKKSTVSGFDTSTEFPGLRTVLQEDYTMVLTHSNYTIYKRAGLAEDSQISR